MTRSVGKPTRTVIPNGPIVTDVGFNASYDVAAMVKHHHDRIRLIHSTTLPLTRDNAPASTQPAVATGEEAGARAAEGNAADLDDELSELGYVLADA